MAYIRKHKSGWRAEVQKDGVRRSHVAATKRDAQAWAMRVEAEIGQFKGSRHTFAQAVERYLSTVSVRKRGERFERLRLNAALVHFGEDTRLSEITSATVAKWRDKRMESVSGSTVQREANLLRNVFTSAIEWQWVEKNPFSGLRLPANNPPRHQVWTWQLIRRVLRAPRTGKTAEMQHAFRIALHTGLRLSEVLSGKYDPARAVISLERTKTGGRVDVPVPRRARRWLPFTGTVGPNEGSVLFSRLCRELLIEGLTFHDARASALTWLSRRVDVLTLARISRHRDMALLLRVYYRESADQISARI